MKILKIRIKNINSLRCDDDKPMLIDLEASPLRDAGLFLITGNTGAGKSSIMDAITLALFGKVPRSTDNNPKHVLTHGTDECLAEVEFETNDQRYRAKWQLNQRTIKGRKGNEDRIDTKHYREIAELPSGTILTLKPNQVQDKITEILQGLTFEQFTRSVMLAQGEFARFLQGGEDRSKVLERITNGEQYSQISEAAFLRHKEAARIRQEWDNKLEQQSIQLLSDEELATIEQNIEATRTRIDSERQTLDEQEQALQQLQRAQQLDMQIANENEKLAKCEARQAEHVADFERLARHQELASLEPTLRQLDQLTNRQQQQHAQIAATKKDLEHFQLELIKVENNQQLQNRFYHELQTAFEQHQKLWQEVRQLDIELRTIKQQGNEAKAELDKSIQQKNDIERKQRDYNEALQTAAPRLETLRTWFEKNALYKKLSTTEDIFDIKDIISKYEHNQQQLKQLQTSIQNKEKELQANEQSQIQISNDYTEQNKKRQDLRLEYDRYVEVYKLEHDEYAFENLDIVHKRIKQQDEFIKDYHRIIELVEHHQILLEQINEQQDLRAQYRAQMGNWDKELLTLDDQWAHLSELRADQELQQFLLHALQHREHLHEGEACPLCLSKIHPFRNESTDKQQIWRRRLEKLQEEAHRNDEFEAKLKEKSARCANEQSTLRHQIETCRDRIEQLRQTLHEEEAQVYQLLQRWQLMGNLDERDIAELETQVADFETKIHQLKELIERAKLWKIEYQAAGEQANAWERQLNERKEQATRIRLDLNLLQQERLLLEERIEQQQTRIRSLLEAYRVTWSPMQSLPACVEFLQQQKRLYDAHDQEEKELLSKQLEWEQLLKSTHENIQLIAYTIEQQTKKVESLRQQWADKQHQRLTKLDEKNPETEEEKEKHILQETLAACQAIERSISDWRERKASAEGGLQRLEQQQRDDEAQLEQLQNLLRDALAAHQLTDVEALRAHLLPEAESTRIAMLQRELDTQQRICCEKISELQTARTLLPDWDDEQLHALQQTIHSLKESINQANIERGQWQQQINDYHKHRAEHAQLFAHVQRARTEESRWERLRRLIGSHDGKEFRRFAQTITLRKLVEMANRHLRHFIDGRYRLRQHAPDSLDLDIVDKFQADNQRALASLSGGETFLASLALALALADLAGGQTKIESLFIDEGFGTLDADTLQIAIDVLQTLRSQGKTIGIISHVEQLQQTIPTQIQVIPRGSGFSEIRIK